MIALGTTFSLVPLFPSLFCIQSVFLICDAIVLMVLPNNNFYQACNRTCLYEIVGFFFVTGWKVIAEYGDHSFIFSTKNWYFLLSLSWNSVIGLSEVSMCRQKIISSCCRTIMILLSHLNWDVEGSWANIQLSKDKYKVEWI